MAKMTGEELFLLIQGLNNICEDIGRGIATNNEYVIGKYDAEYIMKYCEQARDLILKTVYEPVR